MKKRGLTVGTKKGHPAGAATSKVTEQDDWDSHPFDNPFIVPPGIYQAVHDFEAHWCVSDKEPILVLGATGVGKSLFLHLSKQFFKKQNPTRRKKPVPIIEANCAHFSGARSDLNMARSELFGYVAGAFTGATDDKVGLVEKADGGLLVLEEIGELPLEAQAMLLTFVETGEYRRVGDVDNRKAKVKIVGATNREAALRVDFRYRFFPFYIPSLRERKQDILYYFHGIFPRLVGTLNKSEILVLLTHHWPGNVREVERVGRLLLRRRWKPGPPDAAIGLETADTAAIPTQVKTYSDFGLYHLDPRDSPFDPDALINLNDRLRAHLADIALLEKLLNRLRVSIDDQSPTLAFQEMAGGDVEFCFFTEGYDNIKFCNDFPLFEEAFQGYLAFCGLFSQDPAKEENILASLRKCNIENFSLKGLDCSKSDEAKVCKLATAVMAYLKDFDAEDLSLPKEPREFWDTICRLKEESDTDGAYRKFENDEFIGMVCGMRERDLLKNYYLGLLKKTAGNVRMAAKNAGVLETTFRSKLDKLGIKYKRTENSS
jgi:hypothetical protein